MGKVYLVGAGPGDPKLITLRGLELLRKADVIIHDFLANKELLSVARKDAEIIYVGKQASRHELPQGGINSLLVQKARGHGMVVRLKGGDPFIFGRGGEEAVFLVRHGIECEIVPGITSAIAVPAYAGIPLTHRDYASTVAFITGHEDEKKTVSTIRWKELARGPDTLVFLMGIRNLGEIARRLIEGGRGPETPACIIQWGTLPKQRVVTGPLRQIEGIARQAGMKPPGIIVVGHVITVRDQLAWFEKRPLFGKKVAVTRPPHQSLRLGELLSEKGAQVIYLPTVEIEPLEPNKRLLNAIARIGGYDFIVFTSTNGVDVFFQNLSAVSKDVRALGTLKVIAIGPATASRVVEKGLIPDYVPDTFTSEGVAELLAKLDIEGKKFLLPRAKEARDVIVKHIRSRGGSCDVVPVYRATLPREPAPLDDKPDIITFTSSSTVKHFVRLYGKDVLNHSLVASIGPVTTGTLKKNRINVHMEAERYDIPGLVDAIEQYVIGKKQQRA